MMKRLVVIVIGGIGTIGLVLGVAEGRCHPRCLEILIKSDVKAIQEDLSSAGFDPGSKDGVMGPQTRDAIQRFQESEKLPATRKIDRPTLETLEIKIKSIKGQ